MWRSGIALALFLAACQMQPSVQQETAALTLGPDSTAHRQMQTRRFDTKDEAAILSATSGVLQDLGFTIEETAVRSGLIVGSKDRSAIETGQVSSQIFLAALIAALGGRSNPVWDELQKIRISIITKPTADGNAVIVRVNFQRIIWSNQRQISKVESIDDANIYQQFFAKLSEAVFLEAHQI